MATTDETMRILKLINFDEQFFLNQNKFGTNPVILNVFDLSEPDAMEKLQERIFSNGSGMEFIAKCQCGETEGDAKTGMICPVCETRVERANLLDDNNLLCRNWLSCPEDLPGGWLTPKIYLNLAHWLSYDRGKKNYLDDILDVERETPFDLREVIQGKGFGYLHEHFDRIMNYFIYEHPVISKKVDTASMRLCLQLNRDKIFCHYIPILNAAISPISHSDNGPNKRRYVDSTTDHILKAAISLSQLKYSPKKRNRQYHVEKTAFKAFKDVIAYSEEAMTKYVSTKKAIPRTHIFGARFHWSFRAVISPIIGPHRYDELHIPWRLAVNTLRVHILGVLMREYRLSINDAFSKVRRALQIVDPDIKLIMDNFIRESPFPGIPCLWDRPPSIRDGSVMLKYVTRIKTNLDDSCVSITPLDVALPNSDFDGDENYGLRLSRQK